MIRHQDNVRTLELFPVFPVRQGAGNELHLRVRPTLPAEQCGAKGVRLVTLHSQADSFQSPLLGKLICRGKQVAEAFLPAGISRREEDSVCATLLQERPA